MRIKIDGYSESAKAVRGYLQKSGFVSLVDAWADLTIYIEEDKKLDCVVVDGIDTELERLVINGIADKSKLRIQLHRAGGVQVASEIRVIVPGSHPEVEIGMVNGILKFVTNKKPWFRRLF